MLVQVSQGVQHSDVLGTQPGTLRFGPMIDLPVGDMDEAAVRFVDADQQSQQRGLPGAAGAEQGDALAAPRRTARETPRSANESPDGREKYRQSR